MEAKKKKTLTIIIPTWNRARYLEKNLEILDSYLKRGLDFKILVCNNGSTDSTAEVLKKYEGHPHVRIISHPENIKYDRNVASGYLNFDTDFCFCLGDTKSLSYDSLSKMLATINDEDIDALIIKTTSIINKPVTYYTDINDLLFEIGWPLTNISSCVIPKRFITENRCVRYYDSLFIHFGDVIDALSMQNDIKVKYDPTIEKEIVKVADEQQPHGWISNACNVWGRYWVAFVLSLPWRVTLETKFKVIQDANKYYKFLSPGKFVYAKINFDEQFFKGYKENRHFMPFVSSCPLFIYDIISFVPSILYQWMRPILRLAPKYGKNIL